VSNYRPVILTVNLCKVFESIVRDKMIKRLQRHNLKVLNMVLMEMYLSGLKIGRQIENNV